MFARFFKRLSGRNSVKVTARRSKGPTRYLPSFDCLEDRLTPSISNPVDTDAVANIVAENPSNGTTVGITAYSTNSVGGVSYALGQGFGVFAIDSTTGVVTVANGSQIDFESSGGSYAIEVIAFEASISAYSFFTITVTNVAPDTPEDHNEWFGSGGQVLENAAVGQLVGVAPRAFDPAGGTVTYILTDSAGGRFALSGPSWEVSVANSSLIDAGGNFIVKVKAFDGVLDSAEATFTITVIGVNDQPSFTASNPAAVDEDDGAISVSAWATFFPGGGSDEVSQTATYAVSNVSNSALFAVLPAVAANGTLTYTLAADANGTSTFDLAVQDSGGTANGGVDTSGSQTFTITVDAVNDAPSINASDPEAVDEDAGPITISNWASLNPGGGDDEASQTAISYTVTNVSNLGLFTVLPAVAANGTLTYTLAPDANGTSDFDVRVRDSGGVTNGGVDTSTWQTFTITVNAVNDAPVAQDDGLFSVLHDTSFFGDVLDNDYDVDGPTISITEIDGDTPTFGTAITLASGASLTLYPGGSFTYVPVSGTTGSDSFSYTISDGSLTDDATVTIDVYNNAPTGTPDIFDLEPDTDITVPGTSVLGNDSDPDGESLTAALVSGSGPSNGVLDYFNSDGSFKYTPNPAWPGTDSFQYRVSDGIAQSAAIAVALIVQAGPSVRIENDSRGGDKVVPHFGGTKVVGVRVVGPPGTTATLTISTTAGSGTAFFALSVTTMTVGVGLTNVTIYGGNVSTQARNMLLTATAGMSSDTWDFTVFNVITTAFTTGNIDDANRIPNANVKNPGGIALIAGFSATDPRLGVHISANGQKVYAGILIQGRIFPDAIPVTDFNGAHSRESAFNWDRSRTTRVYKNDYELWDPFPAERIT